MTFITNFMFKTHLTLVVSFITCKDVRKYIHLYLCKNMELKNTHKIKHNWHWKVNVSFYTVFLFVYYLPSSSLIINTIMILHLNKKKNKTKKKIKQRFAHHKCLIITFINSSTFSIYFIYVFFLFNKVK